MVIEDLLAKRGMTKYKLAVQAGIPHPTLSDICSGKTKLEKCSAETVYKLSQVLGVSMEQLTEDGIRQTERERAYEYGLPDYLQHDLDAYKSGIKNHSSLLDCLWGELYGSINMAEINDRSITHEHADYLRKKYLYGVKLYNMGIKCLSLFFIDEVAKYRQYDADGNEVLGEYGQMFEQEYINVLNEYTTLLNTPYQKSLKSTCSDVSRVHKGYFSIDKKTGRSIDSQLKRGSEFSDDISAYDLILKNKERLLSFEEPTRFIFSHSALREGWDNPNVFQICTLKHSDSNTAKRQEVGRGLRLCVNQNGNRMDVQSCGDSVHEINTLTVIASESYKTFVADLQSDIKTVLYDRPTVATSEYFKGKYVKVNDVPTLIDREKADAIEFYLIQNGYVDMKRRVTDKYRRDVAMNQVAELPDELKPMSEGIHTLVQAVYDDSVLKDRFCLQNLEEEF